MTYYHKTKTAAEQAAVSMRADRRIGFTKTELVPDNGWVVVVIPKYIDLTEYGDRAEVRTVEGARLTPSPAGRKIWKRVDPPKVEKTTSISVVELDAKLAPSLVPPRTPPVPPPPAPSATGGLKLPWMI